MAFVRTRRPGYADMLIYIPYTYRTFAAFAIVVYTRNLWHASVLCCRATYDVLEMRCEPKEKESEKLSNERTNMTVSSRKK